MSHADDNAGTRRDFLYYATAGAGAVAAGAAVWPLVNQMNPSADTRALSSIFVDVSGVTVGTQLTVKWLGKPVFIRRRTSEEIEAARATPLTDLPDQLAENANGQAGADASDQNRSLDEAGEWLVMMGVCTHLGCVPLGNGAGDFGGWFCPCHGSHYDTSGRIRRGPAPKNLPVPVASFTDETTIQLGGLRNMAGIPHDHYEPKTAPEKWLNKRLPIVGLLYDTIMIPTPKNLNWMWIWGIILTFCLALQIITGIVLVMHYTPHTTLAFASVEHIMRDVNGGFMIRYLHANGASLFFVAVYMHIFRGLYYGSYKAPREVTWIIGMLIYLAMMATAFMGYVLPWGQMSFWGATVITGLFGAIPGIGPSLQEWLLGGPAVENATLNRFFSLHYLLPFVIAGLVAVHIWAFHTTGNNNPTGVEVRRTSKEEAAKDTLPFWPYFVLKDLLALSVILVVFFAIVGFMPNYLGHPDNYIEANPLATPAHIVPEWYFLPFYAILRAFTADVWIVQIVQVVTFGIVDAKFFGVLAMFGAIAVMALVPWLDTSSVRSGRYRPMFKWWFALLALDFIVLMWCGAMPAEEPYATISLIAAAYWFAYFLIILPLLGVIEKPLPIPATIEEDFAKNHSDKTGGTKTVAAE